MEVPNTSKEIEFDSVDLERLKQLLRALNASAGVSAGSVDMGDWWDEATLKANLHISDRTVYRRRKDHTFKPQRIGGRYYYYAPAILRIRDRFIK